MAKQVHNDVLDGALAVLRNNATKMVACAGEPASFTAANGNQKLAEVTLSASDFTIADGILSGRRVTVAEKSNVPVTASGTADHVALLDITGSRLLYVTTCVAQQLTAGQTVTFSSWDVEISDPA